MQILSPPQPLPNSGGATNEVSEVGTINRIILSLAMQIHHATVTQDRWATLSLAEQMGNIGSEVHRTIQWSQRNVPQSFQLAFDRTIELLDLTIADPRWRTGQRELTRTREVFCDFFFGDNSFHTDPVSFQAYFDQFALAARNARASQIT